MTKPQIYADALSGSLSVLFLFRIENPAYVPINLLKRIPEGRVFKGTFLLKIPILRILTKMLP